MKLDCIVVACNENPKYLQFWPIVKKAWNQICGIPCFMIYVGNELPLDLQNDPFVFLFPPIQEWPTATQAQVIRLLYPSLLPFEGAVMISDMDMIPLQKDFFVNGFSSFSSHQFVSLRGIDEYHQQIYMCYVGATPSVWKQLFCITNEQDIRNTMRQWATTFPSNGLHGSLGWCTDQIVLYHKIKEWQQQHPERVGLLPLTPYFPRLDRANPLEWYEWNQTLETNLENKLYIDFHMPSFHLHHTTIERILAFLTK